MKNALSQKKLIANNINSLITECIVYTYFFKNNYVSRV